jgi:aminoglycoside 6-adenylyltransferase
MNQTTSAYTQLLDRFVAWAQTQPDIRAAMILGSRARTDRPADEWSDLDLLVITTDLDRLLSQTDWLENLGTPWLTFLEPTATGGRVERRVLFEGGLDVDFVPAPLELVQQFAAGGWPTEIAAVIRRGARFVLDKDGLAASLDMAPGEPPAAAPPTQDEFLNLVNDFWYHAVWVAKKLRRGELWTAKLCCDSYMKRLVLAMIERHAGAASGWSADTWHNGRFLEQWADPRAIDGLREAFAHYDAADVRRALFATMDLFRWLATEIAARLGYPYPATADERVTALIRDYLSERQ